MKHLQLIGLIVCGAILISCETTQTTSMGNQERKRLAAIQQQERQEDAQMDQSDRNLWNAQQDLLYTGTNPAVLYR
jgi:Mg2+/citrate symporter